MNHLPPAGSDAWQLPQHAHVVVYRADRARDPADGPGERDGEPRGLLTIYDCGAAQAPPSAQVTGHLRAVTAACETQRTPTGSVVSLREPGRLVRDGNDWTIEPADG